MTLAQADIRALPVADNSIDLIWTDPPYPTEFLYCYEWLAREAMRVLKDGGFVAAMCGALHMPKIYKFFEDSGLTYFFELFHKSKNKLGLIWKDGKYPMLAGGKQIIVYSKGHSLPVIGGMQTLFETYAGWSEGKAYHRWGQDVGSARYYIDHFSRPGDIVLDPFVGGGTTLIASELIGRRAIGFDVDMTAIRTSQARLIETEIPRALPLFA